MDELIVLLQELAEKYTVVIIVDELDRCLPEYAIKILERLHHLTENNNNTIMIIAVDKKQLMSSVKQIFGFESPEKYLEKSLHSIQNQTYKNLQIILVDDGSIDSSLILCQKCAVLDKRIEIIHQENGGVVSARKPGFLQLKER